MPQLKVRSISASVTGPALASQSKTAGRRHDASSTLAPTPGGKTRGRFSVMPPPVICAMPWTGMPSSSSFSTLFT